MAEGQLSAILFDLGDVIMCEETEEKLDGVTQRAADSDAAHEPDHLVGASPAERDPRTAVPVAVDDVALPLEPDGGASTCMV